MALIIGSKRWTEKPPVGAQINWGHPLAPDLLLLYNETTGDPFDPVTRVFFTRQNTPLWVVTQKGLALDYNGTNQFLQATVTSPILHAGDVTVVSWFRTTSTTAFGIIWEATASAGNNNLLQCYTTNTSLVRCDTYNSAGTASTVDTGAYAVNAWHQYAMSLKNGGTMQAYLDGVPGTPVSMTGSRNADGGTWKVGATSAASNQFPGQIGYNLVYRSALTQSDINRLYAEPYAFLLPQSPRLRYFFPSVGGPAPEAVLPGHGPLLSGRRNRLIQHV